MICRSTGSNAITHVANRWGAKACVDPTCQRTIQVNLAPASRAACDERVSVLIGTYDDDIAQLGNHSPASLRRYGRPRRRRGRLIGSHLVEASLGLGARVVVDDLSGGDEANFAAFGPAERERLKFVPGSILDRGVLADAAGGCR